MTNWRCEDEPTPFLVRVYARNGAFIHPDDLSSHRPPRHIDIYTTPSCTLANLALLIAAERPETFPVPALGTRVAFQHIYPSSSSSSSNHDSRGSQSSSPRYAARDLGNVVLGGSGPGALSSPSDEDEDDDMGGSSFHQRKLPPLPADEALKFETKTLKQLRFVPGDSVAVAVLLPLDDGNVAPMSTLRRDRDFADRDRGTWGMSRDRDSGLAFRGNAGRREGHRAGGFDIPRGDWRRGDRLPDPSSGRPRRDRGPGRRQW
ncbi:hypothetical protein BROUX41_006231 [Berkeleyomyces rouxiae]|uniref:uncharacterized protein n=1 Tax=Berkeleyomyces rouxiae TaxID=2035830 RepID=UPI003B7BB56F